MVRRDADTKARERYNVWDRRVPTAGEMHYYSCLVDTGATYKPTGTTSLFYRRHAASDGATSSALHLTLSYAWMLDFWLDALGPVPVLMERKVRLMGALRIAANVEMEFAKKDAGSV